MEQIRYFYITWGHVTFEVMWPTKKGEDAQEGSTHHVWKFYAPTPNGFWEFCYEHSLKKKTDALC